MMKGFCPDCSAKLEREGKVVYSYDPEDSSTSWYKYDSKPNEPRHQAKALLINIEPIEKCKHDKDLKYIGGEEWKCKCGAKVKPSLFEAIE